MSAPPVAQFSVGVKNHPHLLVRRDLKIDILLFRFPQPLRRVASDRQVGEYEMIMPSGEFE
jgi:hypothetical protein